MPPERIELSTPGLQDQCSASELRRLCCHQHHAKQDHAKQLINLFNTEDSNVKYSIR